MVGQQHIIQTLQNSLREGRISHAYLFSGPRGTGKTSAAKILAKAVNCENGPAVEPCNQCSACKRITEGAVMDVVEIDAASNRGVEEIRDIRDKVRFAPTEVRQKVYIIDEVHMLTTEAFNALLKTLEEPPGHVMFILATTEPHRLPATIISRCQRFDFHRVSLQEQVEHLEAVCRKENVAYEPEALQLIARLSDGGMRDALSLLDQAASYTDNRITYADALAITGGVASDQFEQLAAAIGDQDIAKALAVIDDLMQEGKSADKCLESLILYFRDLLLIRMIPDGETVASRIVDPMRFKAIADRFSPSAMIQIIEILNHYQGEIKYSVQPQTLLEVAVMKICSFPGKETEAVQPPVSRQQENGVIQQLHSRIEILEKQLSQLQDQIAAGKSAAAPQRPAPAAPAKPRIYRKSGINLSGFLRNPNDSLMKTVKQKWSQVLSQVKEQKITVHAWLIDGEPVALHEQTVLLAFKSSMHRETTEKPANKQLIEQVMTEVLGQPFRLATVMQKEWKEAQEEAAEPPEVLKLKHEEEAGPQEEWIRQAIELFGESLVTIKEES
jgi:DNA polymerase-3 subunit gamma/tau